jgi:hypothetical protein
MEIPLVHWIQWTNKIRMDISRSTLSFGYLNGLVSTWCPYACHYVIQIHINFPTEKTNVRWKFHFSIGSNGQTNSNGHFQVHWMHWIQWTLSFGYLNGLVSTWRPYACHYVIQIHVNWLAEKAKVRWKFHLSIGSNGQTKFQWTFPGPLDPLDTFVWLSQWPSVYMMSICLSLRHSNTW